jgi:hypothetical protein
MNSTNYKKQLEEKLIPNMPLGNTVITDNAPHNMVQEHKPPTTAVHKVDSYHCSKMTKLPLIKINKNKNSCKL